MLVVGNGPAGLLLATELAGRGLHLGIVAPGGEGGPAGAWPANYGLWADELEAAGLAGFAEHRWSSATVRTRDTAPLPRAYVRLDKRALREHLIGHLAANGTGWLDDQVLAVRHDARGSLVQTRSGRTVRATLVVDASGHRSALLHRSRRQRPGFQTAVGWTVEAGGVPLAPAQAVLMDWSDAHLAEPERAGHAPSFLYALPLGGDRWFLEETLLVGRPAVPFALLEQRLRRRLDLLGVRLGRVLEREECWIPMGGSLPELGQRTVGFGGAAGMVHPATGYLIARVLTHAPLLAATIAALLGASGSSPASTAAAAWATLWPPEVQRRRALFSFGMELLLRLDGAQTRDFFHEFFRMPEPDWRGYLSDQLSATQLAGVMARFFAGAPNNLRALMMRTGLRSGLPLGAAVLRSGRATATIFPAPRV